MQQQPDHKTFRAARLRLGLSIRQFAEVLGLGRSTIEVYELGRRKDDGRPVEIPRQTWLAVAALLAGLDGIDADGQLVRRSPDERGKGEA